MAEVASAFQTDLYRVGAILPLEELNGKSILITGATGLIGSAVVKMLLLQKDLKIKIFASSRNISKVENSFEEFKEDERLHFLSIDVVQPITIEEHIEYIIDCASLGDPRSFKINPVGIIRANVMGVDNLLTWGIAHGLEKFVYVSSGEIYGVGNVDEFVESYSGAIDVTEVRSCYPASKRTAESLCVSFASQYGVNVSIARPCHIFGPNFTTSDDRAYAQFFRNVIAKEDIVLKSPGAQIRSWLYVVDCASAILMILLRGENSQAYNIAPTHDSKSIREFALMISQIGGGNLVTQISEESVKNGFIPRAILNNGKLRNLGWSNCFSIEQGIQRTILQLKQDKSV